MRIERLDLTRYGRFTGHALDFGTPEPGKPDLHVVYGPNEAGKSTLFAAWLDLLFGEATRAEDGGKTADYAFDHALKTLEVGARVGLDGDAHELVRTFGTKGRLAGAALEVAGDADEMIATPLRGLDRNAYRTMFSLDDRELEQGGNAVLASKGRLGELLFSSTAGLSGVSATLAEVQRLGEGIYKKGAKRDAKEPTELRAIEAEIARLDAAIAATDLHAERMSAMVAERDAAAAAYATAEAEWIELRAEQRQLERTERALAADYEREEAERALAAMPQLPPTPPDSRPAIDASAVEGARLADREAALARARAALASRREGLAPDPDALAAAPSLDALEARADGDDTASPLARAQTALADLPRREDELATLDRTLRDHLAAIGVEADELDDVAAAARAHMPPAGTEARLRELASQRSGLDVRLADTARELDAAADAHARAADAATGGDEDVTAEAIAEVERLVRRVRSRGSAAALRTAERHLAGARVGIAAKLTALGVADVAALDALRVPSNIRLVEWRSTANRVAEAARERGSRLAVIDVDRATLQREAEAIDVPAAGDALAVRAARDEAWTAHREALGGEGDPTATAAAFERALADDDAVAARCLAALEATTMRREKEAAVARLDAERAVVTRDPDAAERDALTRAAVAAAEPLVASGVLDEASLEALEDGAARYASAMEARERLAVLEGDVAHARDEEDRDAAALGEALAELGIRAEGASDELVEAIEDWHARAANEVSGRERRERDLALATEALERREREANEVRERDAAWHEAWSAALTTANVQSSVGVGEADCAAVLRILDETSAIAATLRERDALAARVRTMRADRDGFLRRLDAIAERLSIAAGDGDWASRNGRVRERVEAARDTANALSGVERDEGALAVEAGELADARTSHQRALDALEAAFGTREPAEMRTRLDAMESRDGAVARRDAALAAIRREMGEDADLSGVDRGELGERIARLTEDEPRLCEAMNAARDALTLARDALERVGGDGAVARLMAERETHLERMAEAGRRALTLHLGLRAADRALHRYRQEHRSAMMERASDAFASMSCGAFAGLGTLPGEGGDVLHAVRPDGRHVEVPRAVGRGRREGGLSTGTRNQLYLALRIAGYHELADRRRPPPFVCDDVLETFDDDRSAATLKLFEAMAREGQVIVLTHHAHLVDLARATVLGVRCHELVPSRPMLSEAAE